MSIIRYLTKQRPTNGFYIKELSIAGYKPDQPETLFIIEIMNVIHKYEDTPGSIGDKLDICKQLMIGNPITPVDNPTETGEYIAHTDEMWQSTRLGSLFTRDRKLWYDVNVKGNKLALFIWHNIYKFNCLKPYLFHYVREWPYTPKYDKYLNA